MVGLPLGAFMNNMSRLRRYKFKGSDSSSLVSRSSACLEAAHVKRIQEGQQLLVCIGSPLHTPCGVLGPLGFSPESASCPMMTRDLR